MIQFDEHIFSDGLKPPTRKDFFIFTPLLWETESNWTLGNGSNLIRALFSGGGGIGGGTLDSLEFIPADLLG